MSRTALLVLGAALVHGLVYSLLCAPWMGEDEPWHLEYVDHVARGNVPGLGRGVALTHDDLEHHALSQLFVKRRLPALEWAEIEGTQRAILAAMDADGFWRRVDWAAPNSAAHSFDQIQPGFTAVNQPPLYYLAAGAWLGVLGGDGARARLVTVRLLSLALYAATVLFAWGLACLAFEDPACRAAAVLVALCLPIHARHAALANNDVLAAALSALLLLLAARILRADETQAAGRLGAVPAVLCAAALAILTKTTAAGAAALAVLVALTSLVQRRSRARLFAGAGLGAAIVLAAAFYWHQQHNPGLPRGVASYLSRVDEGLSWPGVYDLWVRFAGRLNWNSRGLPGAYYVSLLVGAALALLGALAMLRGRRPGLRRSVLLLCVAALVAQTALVFLRGVAEGRYLTPAAPALGVIAAAGLVAPWPPAWRARAAVALAALLLALDAAYVWGGLVLHHHLVWNA